VNSVTEAGENAAQTETQGGCWDEPTRADIFTQGGAWDFEEDVADVEDAEHGIVVVTLEVEVFLEAGQTCIADVGSVNEAWNRLVRSNQIWRGNVQKRYSRATVGIM
jgi:hypothetical protein